MSKYSNLSIYILKNVIYNLYITVTMIINCSYLVNEDFEFIEEGYLTIDKGIIVNVGEGFLDKGIDAKEYIVMPALINSHTHIGDSFAKEASLGLDVDKAVGKKGIKWRLYKEVDEYTLLSSMQDSARYMLNSGITTFVDFREGGIKGLNLLKEAIKEIPINSIVLGRDLDTEAIDICDGLGLNTYQLDQIPKGLKNKNRIIAIHAGEAKGEVELALNYDPDIIVHFTHCNERDIKIATSKKISVVICPRSNASLGVGFPPVKELLESGVNIALGTDNVMINSPDMFRELEFLLKFSYLHRGIKPEEVLRMATVNAAKALRLNSGVIGKGKNADLIFIDKNAPNLRYNKNPIATIVNRCQSENVRKIMVHGKFVIDKGRVYN